MGPQDTRLENQIIERASRLKTTEPRRCRWRSTATTPYNGTGNQTQIAQIRSTTDVKPSMLRNSRTNYRPRRNKSRRRENILEKTQWTSSISLYLSSISLYSTTSGLELYRRKSGHHDPRKTFQVSEDNTSWGTRCQPQNRVHATKNSYRLRQSPSMHACSYLLYSLLVHSLISSSDVENHALLHILRFLIMTYSVRAKHNLS